MYPKAEIIHAKYYEARDANLFVEMHYLARELIRQWPDDPKSWFYLAETFGWYFGLGKKAGEAIHRGLELASPGSKTFNKILPLAYRFAPSPSQMSLACEMLLKYLPKHEMAPNARELVEECRGQITDSVLCNYHKVNIFPGPVGMAFGLSAAHADLALGLISPTDIKGQLDISSHLIEGLGSADASMNALRADVGLGFAANDRLSLHHRLPLIQRHLEEFDPEDAKMWNRLAGTYLMLDRYNECIEAADKAFMLGKDTKPLVNGAAAENSIALEHHRRGEFDEAVRRYDKVISRLEQALSLSGDSGPAGQADEMLKRCRRMRDSAAGKRLLCPHDDIVQSLANISGRLVSGRAGHLMVSNIKRLGPSFVAVGALVRFKNLKYPEAALQCTSNLLEDMFPAFVAEVFQALCSRPGIGPFMLQAAARIATDEQTHGVMSREAQAMISLFILRVGTATKNDGLLRILEAMAVGLGNEIPNAREALISWLRSTIGPSLYYSIPASPIPQMLPPGGLSKEDVLSSVCQTIPRSQGGKWCLIVVMIGLIVVVGWIIRRWIL